VEGGKKKVSLKYSGVGVQEVREGKVIWWMKERRKEKIVKMKKLTYGGEEEI